MKNKHVYKKKMEMWKEKVGGDSCRLSRGATEPSRVSSHRCAAERFTNAHAMLCPDFTWIFPLGCLRLNSWKKAGGDGKVVT